MSETLSKVLVFTILRHAEVFPWRMQDVGLLGLRLDNQRAYRLHVWDPDLQRRGSSHPRSSLRLRL